jgi:hypothetical protein
MHIFCFTGKKIANRIVISDMCGSHGGEDDDVVAGRYDTNVSKKHNVSLLIQP